MDKKEVFEKITALFKKHGFMKEEQKFESAKTADGKTLQWEGELKAGTPISLIGDDGNPMPAEGTYEISDGQKIVCVSGLVTEVMAKEAPKADEPDFTKAFEEIFGRFKTIMDEFTVMQTKFSESQTKFNELQTKFDAIDKSVKEATANQNTLIKELGEQLEAFGKTAAIDTPAPHNVLFKQVDKGKQEKEIKDYAVLLKALEKSQAKA